ncbi:MAG TPA: chaperone modulator CbpM [Geminicoccaceae bacterium]|nr:chaperone modulator CbpM [Geminicoccaceae bacterium]
MKSLEEVLGELETVERAEVLAWVEASWVRPDPDESGLRFAPVDVARLRLVRELRHDLAIDDEAMPVVLSLVDEMYALRRRLGALARALAETPAEVRTTVFTRCQVLMQASEDEPGHQAPDINRS